MKTRSLIVIASSFVLIGGLPAEEAKPKKQQKKMPPEMVGKFDKDGDGELNEEELAAAKASQGGKKVGKKRAEVIAKYDKDGDGELNGEEQAAVRADKKQKLVEQFDEDKDGKLNEEEKAKMNELIQKRHDSHKKPAEAKGGGAPKEGAEPPGRLGRRMGLGGVFPTNPRLKGR